MCTSGACASASNGMMPPRNSSSRSAVLDTSSTPTRWSRRLALQFLVPALVAVAGALVVAAPWLWTRLERREIDTLRERLTTEATLLGEAVPWAEGAPLQDTCTRLSRDLGLRVTVIATAGLVLCDSARSGTGARIEDQSEVREALAAGRGYAVRADGPAGERVMYAAIRQAHDGATRIVRVAVPLSSAGEAAAQTRWLFLSALLLGLLLAAG